MDGFLAFLFRGLFQFQCSVLLFSIDAVFWIYWLFKCCDKVCILNLNI
jgi:hypothetical protein